MTQKLDIKVGEEYYRLTIIEEITSGKSIRRFRCMCDCGNITDVNLVDIRSGNTKSCGCLKKENDAKGIHNMSDTRMYGIWKAMKRRCYNKNTVNYCNYGGRGIYVCDAWRDSFKDFYDWSINNNYHKTLSIDRIDNNDGYTPFNCAWSTYEEQATNRRVSKSNSSGYTGVYFRENFKSNQWESQVTSKGKTYQVGCFDSVEAAVSARNAFITKNNFPHKLQEV